MFEHDVNSQEFLDSGMSAAGETEIGGQEGVVDPQESQYDEEFYLGDDGHEEAVDPHSGDGEEEGSEEGENDPAPATQGRAKNQTREDNSAARQARLRAEREADERIARSGMLNPTTGRPFRNMEELERFGKAQREAEVQRIAKQTGRNADDVREEMNDRDFVRELREAGEAQRAAAQAAEQKREFLVRDAQNFREKHPGVDIVKLEQNRNFRKFCGSRFGVEPLAELYDDYKAIVGGAESAGRAGAESRRSRSTGSGSAGGEVLSASQRAALAQWNRDNPDMKMTAKEFLGR